MSIRRNHYLEQRGQRWYYVRRVPTQYRAVDTRRRVKVALLTDSLTIARKRRDALMDADEHFWESSLAKKVGSRIVGWFCNEMITLKHSSHDGG